MALGVRPTVRRFRHFSALIVNVSAPHLGELGSLEKEGEVARRLGFSQTRMEQFWNNLPLSLDLRLPGLDNGRTAASVQGRSVAALFTME